MFGGTGGRLPGKGGGARGGMLLVECFDRSVFDWKDVFTGAESADGNVGRRPGIMGIGLGASAVGGCGGGGTDGDDSADKDDDLVAAPVSIPPLRFFNLGIPPAKRPPSCGASAIIPKPPLLSLLLRTLDVVASLGFSSPGIGGALGAAPPPSFGRSRIGAERSFVTAFFNRVPFVISESSAPYCLLVTTRE